MAEASPRPTSWIRHAVDGAPAVVFLIVLLVTRNFPLATWFVVGGSALALVVGLVVERRLAPLPAFSGVLALVFGGASLLLHRADILQMKMTIVDGVLGAVLFGGLALKKNPLKALLGGAFDLTDGAWRAKKRCAKKMSFSSSSIMQIVTAELVMGPCLLHPRLSVLAAGSPNSDLSARALCAEIRH